MLYYDGVILCFSAALGQASLGQAALGQALGWRSGRQCEALGQGMAGQREALRALGM